MTELDYRVNHQWRVSRHLIGREQTPVIIIDDFLLNTDTLRSYAENEVTLTADDGSYYPGIRADLPQAYAMAAVSAVYQQLYKVYDIPTDYKLHAVNCVYSLVSFKPEQLEQNQRRPHFDTPYPYHFALLHYLNEGEYGPTGFFRHRASGTEKVSPEGMNAYLEQANQTNAGEGYIKGNTQEYELIGQIPYKANRLVIYPGNLLHSVLIDEQSDINPNPTNGRLTANIFIEYLPS